MCVQHVERISPVDTGLWKKDKRQRSGSELVSRPAGPGQLVRPQNVLGFRRFREIANNGHLDVAILDPLRELYRRFCFELDGDVREGVVEFIDRAHDRRPEAVVDDADRNRSRGSPWPEIQIDFVEDVDDLVGLQMKIFAGGRLLHHIALPVEELAVELGFEPLDLMAEGGLRAVEPGRRARDVSFVGNFQEAADHGSRYVETPHAVILMIL